MKAAKKNDTAHEKREHAGRLLDQIPRLFLSKGVSGFFDPYESNQT
jgi:hypothetical protein